MKSEDFNVTDDVLDKIKKDKKCVYRNIMKRAGIPLIIIIILSWWTSVIVFFEKAVSSVYSFIMTKTVVAVVIASSALGVSGGTYLLYRYSNQNNIVPNNREDIKIKSPEKQTQIVIQPKIFPIDFKKNQIYGTKSFGIDITEDVIKEKFTNKKYSNKYVINIVNTHSPYYVSISIYNKTRETSVLSDVINENNEKEFRKKCETIMEEVSKSFQ